MKKARATVLISNAERLNSRLKIQQLQNDLNAAKRREELHRDSELKLVDQLHAARRDHAAQSNELVKAFRERDDWRDAFKLIMRLVK